MNDGAALAGDFARHERLIWGLCYRMTGSAADADDLVQDTFVRAIERPPARDGDTRPWLVKVALNLAKDRLRARRRREYRGEWLPALVPTARTLELPSYEPDDRGLLDEGATAAHRYELIESVSMAFLLALEALTPRQRAVLLLCDVFEYSGKQAAEALGMSEGNVKVSHHRARRALDAYDAARVTGRDLGEATQSALEAFIGALVAGDEAAARAMLTDDVVALNDGGADFSAAKIALHGPERVTQVWAGLTKHGSPVVSFRWMTLGGLPALVLELAPTRPNLAPLVVMQAELDADGRIRRLYAVLAREKLKGLAAQAVG